MKYDYLKAAELSDVGRQRRRNEDKTLMMPDHGIYGVFDGMGGSAGGGEASESAAETIRRKFTDATTQPPAGMASLKGKVIMARAALNEASNEIRERADALGVAGSGTTAVVMVFDAAQPQRAIILHAGDSRAYRFRDGQLTQLTRDHSFAVAAGVHSERSLPPMFRGVVTRAVGLEREVVLEETLVDVATGDTFMLCSDGVTKMIADAALIQIFNRGAPDGLSALAAVLIEEANTAGGHDNASVVLIGVTGFVPAAAPRPAGQPGSSPLLPPITSKPVTEIFPQADPQRILAERRTSKKKPLGNFAVISIGAIATVIVVAAIYWLNTISRTVTPSVETAAAHHPAATQAAPLNVAAVIAAVPEAKPARNTNTAQTVAAVSSPPALNPPTAVTQIKVEPIVSNIAIAAVTPPIATPPVVTQKIEVAVVRPPVAPPVTTPPVTPATTTNLSPSKPEVAMARPPNVAPVPRKMDVAVTQSPSVPPPIKVENQPAPPRQPARTPEAVAAAQATMEMLMGDIVTALSGGHWSFVEDMIAEWAPTSPYEAAALTAWPVYRNWSAVWREASTGQRSAAELYEPYRERISSSLREMGAVVTNVPSPKWGKNPKSDADALCRARFDAQNLLIEQLRRHAEDSSRISEMLQQGGLLDMAEKLVRRSKHADIQTLGIDLDARSKALVASARAARGSPEPMSVDDIASKFAGWTSLHVTEELLWPALTDIIRSADLPAGGDSARRKELEALQDKIVADRKKSGDFTKWLAGDGPANVIKFLMLAQSLSN